MEQFNVKGMSCAACSARVEKAVSKVISAKHADMKEVNMNAIKTGAEF